MPVPPVYEGAVAVSARPKVVTMLVPAVNARGFATTKVNVWVAVALTLSVTVIVSAYEPAVMPLSTLIAPVLELMVT